MYDGNPRNSSFLFNIDSNIAARLLLWHSIVALWLYFATSGSLVVHVMRGIAKIGLLNGREKLSEFVGRKRGFRRSGMLPTLRKENIEFTGDPLVQ